MLGYAGGFILLAAVLHASWNALLHGNRDRFLSMTWMSIAIGASATIAVLFSPPLPAAAWPYAIASGVMHILYNMSLVRTYRSGDLAQAYPIARGSSPLLVTLGAAVFAHDTIHGWHIAGIVMISGGIIALALQDRHVSRANALPAFMTGATIAIYTVLDGMGVRHSGAEVIVYTTWMFMFYWAMPLLFIAARGLPALFKPIREAPMSIVSSIVGGLVSVAAYGIVIWAMQMGAMGAVSALRETSVVFAVLIGRLFLGEKVSGKRWLACLVVAAGAVCLGI